MPWLTRATMPSASSPASPRCMATWACARDHSQFRRVHEGHPAEVVQQFPVGDAHVSSVADRGRHGQQASVSKGLSERVWFSWTGALRVARRDRTWWAQNGGLSAAAVGYAIVSCSESGCSPDGLKALFLPPQNRSAV